MEKRQDLIIIGAGETAKTIYEYFHNDSHYNVIAFSVEEKFISEKLICGCPVVPFEDLEKKYSPKNYLAFIAISYTDLNKVREFFFKKTKEKGFSLVKFISSKSYIAESATIGENCFVYDNCSISHNVNIQDNSVICSGTVISHSAIIGENVFVAPNSSIGGYSKIGNNCFIGIGSVITDLRTIINNCIISAGSVLFNDANFSNIYKGNPAKDTKINSEQYIKIKGGII